MADEVYAKVEPIAAEDAQYGYPTRALVRAIGSMFGQVEETIRADATHNAWTAPLDVNRCPAYLLPWMGQAVGVAVTPGTTTAEMRAQISEEGAWKRGWLTTWLAIIGTTLTGTKRIRLTERSSGAWQALIVTKPSETPSASTTERVGNANKPVGLVVTYSQSEVPLIDEGGKTIDSVAFSIDTATYEQVH